MLAAAAALALVLVFVMMPKSSPSENPEPPNPTPAPSPTPTPDPTPAPPESPANGDILTIEVKDGVSFNMVYVEGGTFTMGATGEQWSDAERNEEPAHEVKLDGYYIGETEVTQELWEAVMRDNPSSLTYDSSLPVENVSWEDCKAFIEKLNSMTGKTFRLPTEAEWEYAARGGNKSRHTKYSGGSSIDAVAWYYNNACDKGESSPDYGTHPVAKKSPNELGLYDMSGNVWEWCEDWYGDYSSSAQTNPKGPASASYRVIRGGSWFNGARRCRVSFRFSWYPAYRNDYLGMRLAL